MGTVIKAADMQSGDQIVVKGRHRWLVDHCVTSGRISVAVGHTERGRGEKFVLRVLADKEVEIVRTSS